MVYILAKFVVTPEKREDFLELSKPLIAGTHAEEGCIQYVFTATKENPNEITIIEAYKNMEAIEYHFKTEHFLEYIPQLKALCSKEPDISILHDVH